MNATRKVKLNDINPNLTCKLCMGYLVDATTIIECLHSFCKSCIIKYLEKSADLEEKYFCPICEIQLHETKPLTSIRSDSMLQEIVYKLVPGLFKKEMSRRRDFYLENKESRPNNQLDSGQIFDELYITSDDLIHLSLEYVTNDVKLRETTRRYLKCPAAVSICILKKFIHGKYDLDSGANVDIMYGDRILPEDFLLMDVAYKYAWTMNGSKPVTLRYRIKGQIKPAIKPERTINESISSNSQPLETHKKTKKVCNENGSNIMPSEEMKNNPIKIPRNGMPGELTIVPLKSPNTKMKNRRRKRLNYSDIVDIKDGIAKRLKFDKPVSKSKSNSRYQSSEAIGVMPTKESKSGEVEEGKEVQLQISENGVMSARSVSFAGNGEEKIILNLASPSSASASKASPSPHASQTLNPAEKLLLSGNFHSKTGPSGVTEIICDKPAPITSSMKPIAPKPGYVTLNIPNPAGLSSSQRNNPSPTNQLDRTKKIPVTNLYDSSPNATHAKAPIEIKVSDKPSNKSLLEKIRNRITGKGKEGDSVIQAINDLGKLCSTSAVSNGTPNNGINNVSITSGVHTHVTFPLISTLSNPGQHSIKTKGPNNFPFSLNFPPSSGMSVSMIPCTSSATNNIVDNNNSTTCSQSTTPPKRISPHQTTVVNGDLKFSTSPKQLVNGDRECQPKKPPKFFKSRHTTSPLAQKTSLPEIELKRKTPVHMKNGILEPPKKKTKERNGSPKSTANANTQSNSKGIQSCSNFSAVTTTNGADSHRPIPYPPQANESVFSQPVKAINGIQTTDAFNSSFGIAAAAAVAAAAANGNGVRPFLSDGYVSMPYGYGTILSQLMLPQYYNSLNFTGAATPSSLNAGTSLNLIKSKGGSPPLQADDPASNGKNAQIPNGLSSSSSDNKKERNPSTLDLSISKNGSSKGKNDKDVGKHPLLSSLLGKREATGSKTPTHLGSPSSKPNGNLNRPEVKPQSVSAQNGLEKSSLDKMIETVKNEKESTRNGHENGDSEKNDTEKKSENPDNTKISDIDLNKRDSSEYKDVSKNNDDSVKDLDSSFESEKLLSQNNNNNHVPERKSEDLLSLSASEDTKVKKSLECADQQISNASKSNCKGNNNVPSHAPEIGSNSGSA